MKKAIVVVGADGFVGGRLAQKLDAARVVYRAPLAGETAIGQAESVLRQADVIVNAAGFRVRPGLSAEDYRRSHVEATAQLLPFVKPDALFLHVSSASVLGKSRHEVLGNDSTPRPELFPCPAYAQAKAEADAHVLDVARQRGFRVILFRPSVLYAPDGEGMVASFIQSARKGRMLRLYPRSARHHFCDMKLFIDGIRRAITSTRLPNPATLVLADPYIVTNRELETLVREAMGKRLWPVPIFLGPTSFVLRHTFRSKSPRWDLKTWGEIFGVMNLDTVYDPWQTYELLDIDASKYALERTLKPLVEKALR